jgi:hypothetical protein
VMGLRRTFCSSRSHCLCRVSAVTFLSRLTVLGSRGGLTPVSSPTQPQRNGPRPPGPAVSCTLAAAAFMYVHVSSCQGEGAWVNGVVTGGRQGTHPPRPQMAGCRASRPCNCQCPRPPAGPVLVLWPRKMPRRSFSQPCHRPFSLDGEGATWGLPAGSAILWSDSPRYTWHHSPRTSCTCTFGASEAFRIALAPRGEEWGGRGFLEAEATILSQESRFKAHKGLSLGKGGRSEGLRGEREPHEADRNGRCGGSTPFFPPPGKSLLLGFTRLNFREGEPHPMPHG